LSKSKINAFPNINILAQKFIEVDQDLFACFIDYSKAFDRFNHAGRADYLFSENWSRWKRYLYDSQLILASKGSNKNDTIDRGV